MYEYRLADMMMYKYNFTIKIKQERLTASLIQLFINLKV